MSLEDALKENTAAVKLLCTLISALPGGITTAASVAAEAKPADTPTLSYDEHVKKPFMLLLNTKREAAMKLLADLGVSNLKGFENQSEKFVELSQKIQEAQNG